TVWTGRYMILWGGFDENFSNQNTGARYDPITDIWSPVSTENAPAPRAGNVALGARHEMLVWGGINDDFTFRNDGGRYDPITDRWTSISLVNAPSSRSGAVAVWTGERMVIWGGRAEDSFNLPNTGGIYDPISDTWRATSTLNAPI